MALNLGSIQSAVRGANRPRLIAGTTETVHVEGLAELERELNKLAQDVAKKVMPAGMRAGARVIQREAKSRAPFRTGRLKSGIRLATRIRGLGVRGALVKVSIGLRKFPKTLSAFYGRFLEFGTGAKYTQPRARRASRRGRIMSETGGGISPRPFMGPAFEAKRRAALDKIIDALKKRIARAKR